MRQEKARRAQLPMIWMTRVFYAVSLALTLFLAATIPDFSKPAVTIGLASLAAIAFPASIVLWLWFRSDLD